MTTSRKKQWEIIPRSKRATTVKGLIIGGKRRKLGSAGMILTDAGEAKEVDQTIGDTGSKDFTVVEIDDADPKAENRGGKRTRKLWIVNLPWKK